MMRSHRPSTVCRAVVLVAMLAAFWGCSASLPDDAQVRAAPPEQLQALAASLAARVQADPEDGEALARLALVELRLGRTAQAVTHARQATNVAPFEAEPHRVLGEAFAADGSPQRAQAAYAQAIALEPGHLPTYRRQARLQAQRNERAAALGTLQRLLGRDPEDHDALLLRTDLLIQDDALADAEETIRRARALRPDDHTALRRHVEILRRQGRVDDAIRLASEGLEPSLRDRDLLQARAQMHRGRADWAAAQADLERLRGLGPLTPEEWLLQVEVLDGLGRPAEAGDALSALLESRPDFAPVHVRLAERRLRAGRAAEALEAARRATTLAPQMAEAHYWVAAAAFMLGDPEAGESALEIAERQAPERPAVRLLRVGRLLAGGRLDAAGDALEQLAEDAPRLLAVHLYDSERLALRGNVDAAAQVLLRLPPDFSPADVDFARLRIAYLRGEWAQVVNAAPTLAPHPLVGWRATFLQASALLQLGRWSEGAEVVAPLAEGSGRRVEFVYLSGYLKLLQGDRVAAQRTFLSGQALAPASPLMAEALSRMALDAQDWDRAQGLLEQGLKAPGPFRDVFLERLGRVGQGRRSAELSRKALVQSLATRYVPEAGTVTGPSSVALSGSYLPDFGRLGGG